MDWRWDFTFDTVLPRILPGLWVTVEVTFLSFILTLVLGLVLMLARRSRSRIISFAAGEFIEFMRGMPLLVVIFFLFFLLPEVNIYLAPFWTGVLAMGIYNAAPAAEIMRGGLQAVPKGQWEAAHALNYSTYRTWRNVILPQAIGPVVPGLGNLLILAFKETPLLSFVAVPEMPDAARRIASETYRFTEPLTVVGILFLILSLASALLIRLVERHMLTENRYAK
ncbi:ectoine/hydroxyectoine ABC transporter permease subunit EhuD [Nioella sp. MMSF_3534]|uniref:ectoine/hydroxyectoine ABC transporter permease subunit EhuD n=1 Tax=Nioella sp. MMSF_3534 TaxID=3046720 RepID=UPI00273CFA9B|nr:ectoine/hydroxyectoine ABC transporter permease subunit EhuD [Nioella sp. MMSF_3534]